MGVDHVGKHDGNISLEKRTCQPLAQLEKPQDDHKFGQCWMILVRLITRRSLHDDLAGIEVAIGIHGAEEPFDHVHTWRGDVLLQPRGMLGAHRMVMRECATRVDEGLLDCILERLILTKRVDAVVLEGEGEVQAGAGVVGVRGGT